MLLTRNKMRLMRLASPSQSSGAFVCQASGHCAMSTGRLFKSNIGGLNPVFNPLYHNIIRLPRRIGRDFAITSVMSACCYSTQSKSPSAIRNIGVIAHVDHGKTSLVDQLLKQSGAAVQFDTGARVMDSNQLEKERGITILSKSTGIPYKDTWINIVDTPGHADFGGEVERVLNMVDAVLLVVCATEGPMTQTKFVLKKALARGLVPIVVINKVDRDTAQVEKVEEAILDLFITLDANEEQLDYRTIYASAKDGWAKLAMDDATPQPPSIHTLLDKIVELAPAPKGDTAAPFSMLVTQIEEDAYVGKCYMGRIHSGTIRVGDAIQSLDTDGEKVVAGKVTKLLIRTGLTQVPVESAVAGEIVSIAGISGAYVNHTICDVGVKAPLPHTAVDQPTIGMMFYVNDSPLGGKEGKFVTSQVIRDRLIKETETNPSLHVKVMNDAFKVFGRGELQMGVLIETMRREGFELSVSPPRVIFKRDKESGDVLEPIEEVVVDVDPEFTGIVIEKMSRVKGEMKAFDDSSDKARLVFHVPTRGLLGYPADFKNDTHGQGTLTYSLVGYEPFKGPIEKTRKGSIVSMASGDTTAYSLRDVEARGRLFVGVGTPVYPGMIIGEHSRDVDCEVNPVKAKALTNMRAAGKEDTIRLTPIKEMGLERMLSYIQDDEVIEVTPSALRVRKKELDATRRRSMTRKGGVASNMDFADEDAELASQQA